MQFKIGDKVRLTRDCLWAKILAGAKIDKQEMFWFSIEKMDNSVITSPYPNYHESVIELVPEEPEFKYWEEIEVGDEDWRRRKRIFLLKIPWNVIDPYVVVERGSNERFQFGGSYDVEVWRYARKPRSSLTRKEIAEKFWVAEDFILVD